MSNQAQLQNLNNQVQFLLNNKDFNNPKVKTNLKKAKFAIYNNPNFETESQAYLIQAIRFAQLNLMFTLVSRSNKEYENAINNVKFFYENTLVALQPQFHSMITAIHLLFLLSANRNKEFYSKLESITSTHLQDQYISYVLLLNDAIEQGNYRKIFSLSKQNPLPDYFGPFLDRISQTIRTEIAKSAEKAYSELSLKEALSIFQFESIQQLRNFSQVYQSGLQEVEVNWLFKEDKIIFEKEINKKTNFNSQEMITRVLRYSLQLERIA